MKKVIISLILLLVVGIIVLVIGFIYIPQDSYGVVQTMISGIDEKVYPPGTIMWRWEKLLPTALAFYKFKLTPYKKEIESPIKGSLYPSGNDYAKALGESFDFSFEFNVNVEFVIIPDKLPLLVKDGLKPDNLSTWYEDVSGKLSESLFEIVLAEPDIFMKYKRSELLKQIQTIIGDQNDFHGITLLAIDPKNVNIPDYDAYKALKEKYFNYLTLKSGAHNEMIQAEKQLYLEAVQKEIEIIRNIDKYGELLTKYPSILEFLQKTNQGYLKESIDPGLKNPAD
ncbi:MAG: hypothetical protein JXB88_08515 [Spirochaetales bacterium]|nr:hypothetical protein [Spirochaetales bacterium]